MIEQSICYEVKDSARPQGGQKRPFGTFPCGRSGRRKACPHCTVDTPGFPSGFALHYDDMMYVMCAPIPHGAKVRARGLVTHTLGAISPPLSASSRKSADVGGFSLPRPPRPKAVYQRPSGRAAEKNQKKSSRVV